MKVAANPVKLSFNRGPKCPNDLDFISELWVFSCGVRAPPASVTTIRWRSNRCYGGDCSCQIAVEEDWLLLIGKSLTSPWGISFREGWLNPNLHEDVGG